jgi:hypothetical protein
VKRRLCDLDRGTLFRTGDGLLWRPGYPHAGARRWCHAMGRPHASTDLPADAEVEVVDPDAVLARAALLERENAELRAVLHDLWQDRDGTAAGAAAERGAVEEVLAERLAAWGGSTRDFVDQVRERLSARGPTHPPVPPCVLEGAVREAVAFLGEHCDEDWYAPSLTELRALLPRLRAALGEG